MNVNFMRWHKQKCNEKEKIKILEFHVNAEKESDAIYSTAIHGVT